MNKGGGRFQRDVLKLDREKCRNQRCLSGLGVMAHHIIYKSHGIDNRVENGIALCAECHDLVQRGGKFFGVYFTAYEMMILILEQWLDSPEFRWTEALEELRKKPDRRTK